MDSIWSVLDGPIPRAYKTWMGMAEIKPDPTQGPEQYAHMVYDRYQHGTNLSCPPSQYRTAAIVNENLYVLAS